MSSKKTPYLNMHDWIGADPWRRAEISENFQKLDDKSKKLDTSMAETVLTAADAKLTAENIDAKAQSALSNSASAVSSVEAVVQTANAADIKATNADLTSGQALTKATAAEAKATTAETTSQSVRGELDRVIADAGGNNPEVVAARGNDINLGARLNGLGQQLAEKALQSELEIERARISNLTANAGNTDGNAELLDIRVGFDGTTYTTAGEATRMVKLHIDGLQTQLDAHKSDNMPHLLYDVSQNKTVKIGMELSQGKPRLVFEEVLN